MIETIKKAFRVYRTYNTVRRIWKRAEGNLVKYGFEMLPDGRIMRECTAAINIASTKNCVPYMKEVVTRSYEENINTLAAVLKVVKLDEYVDVTYDNLYFLMLDENDKDYDDNTIIARYDMVFVPNSDYEPDWESYLTYALMKRIIRYSIAGVSILAVILLLINIL